VSKLTGKALAARAKELNIPGRSSMTADQLRAEVADVVRRFDHPEPERVANMSPGVLGEGALISEGAPSGSITQPMMVVSGHAGGVGIHRAIGADRQRRKKTKRSPKKKRKAAHVKASRKKNRK
jgi:hypothetical protein